MFLYLSFHIFSLFSWCSIQGYVLANFVSHFYYFLYLIFMLIYVKLKVKFHSTTSSLSSHHSYHIFTHFQRVENKLTLYYISSVTTSSIRQCWGVVAGRGSWGEAVSAALTPAGTRQIDIPARPNSTAGGAKSPQIVPLDCYSLVRLRIVDTPAFHHGGSVAYTPGRHVLASLTLVRFA